MEGREVHNGPHLQKLFRGSGMSISMMENQIGSYHSPIYSAGGSNSAEMGTKVTHSEPKAGSVHSFQLGTWTLICTTLFIGHLKEFHVVKELFVLKTRIN